MLIKFAKDFDVLFAFAKYFRMLSLPRVYTINNQDNQDDWVIVILRVLAAIKYWFMSCLVIIIEQFHQWKLTWNFFMFEACLITQML